MRLIHSLTGMVLMCVAVAAPLVAQSPAPPVVPSPSPTTDPISWTTPVPGQPVEATGTPAASASQKTIPCGTAAAQWMALVMRGLAPAQLRHVTAVMVNEYGDPCGFFADRDFSVAGDPIFSAVYTTPTTVGASVGLANCGAENAVSLQSSGDLFQPQSKTPGKPWQDAPRRVCHGGGTVEVVATTVSQENGKLGTPSVKKTALVQYARYRATLQLGAIYTTNHEVTFGLRKDGDQNRIFTQTATDRGPEYVGILNVYAIPRYFQRQPWGGFYKGRDIVHDQGLSDRIGLVFGAGLSKPSSRFLAGASLELFPGVSVIGVHEWAQVTQLVGLEDGAPFAEAADKIPTRDEWSRGWYVGASFDLLYAAKLFGKKP